LVELRQGFKRVGANARWSLLLTFPLSFQRVSGLANYHVDGWWSEVDDVDTTV
jgi:hypothetical protein